MQKRYNNIATLNKTWGTAFKGYEDIDFPGRKDKLIAFNMEVQSGDPHARRRWLDFIDWYRAAMTEWADWWMGTTRKYFRIHRSTFAPVEMLGHSTDRILPSKHVLQLNTEQVCGLLMKAQIIKIIFHFNVLQRMTIKWTEV